MAMIQVACSELRTRSPKLVKLAGPRTVTVMVVLVLARQCRHCDRRPDRAQNLNSQRPGLSGPHTDTSHGIMWQLAA